MVKFTIIDRSSLVKTLKRLQTDGQVSLRGKKGKQILSVYVTADKDGNICFFGKDVGSIMYGRTRGIKGKTEIEGMAYLDDFDQFIDDLESLESESGTIEIDDSKYEIIENGSTYSFPVKNVPEITKLIEWNKYHYYKEDKLTAKDKDGEYFFEHWYDLDEAETLKSVSGKIFKRNVVDDIIFDTSDQSLMIGSINKNDNKGFTKDVEAKIIQHKQLRLNNIFPVLDKLSGEAKFHFYINSKGKIYLWVTNGSLEWMVISQPEEKKEEKSESTPADRKKKTQRSKEIDESQTPQQ